jgi:hypothetical protein
MPLELSQLPAPELKPVNNFEFLPSGHAGRQPRCAINRSYEGSNWANTNLEMCNARRITYFSGILYDCRYLIGLIFMHPGYKITEISSHCRNPKLGDVKKDFHLYLHLYIYIYIYIIKDLLLR